MTFSTSVPNATQSPGLFPFQSNTNFTRLKAIINSDHNFTDAASTSQGTHKQSSYINKTAPTVPVSLPVGINGILYSINDSSAASQLRWFNGGTDYQLTGGPALLAKGTIAIATNSVANMFTVPDNSFGIIYMWRAGTLLSSAIIEWQTVSGTVACMQVPAYTGSSSSGTQIPVTFISNGSLQLIPFTTAASFNGNYNYRIFQVP